jgi:hypothetical protein
MPGTRWCGLAVALVGGCTFSPLDTSAAGQPFTPGVYRVEVDVQDGCGQIRVSPTPSLDCRGGLWTEGDDGLVAFWPELDGDTIVVHDDVLVEVLSAPVLRWSGSDREVPSSCTVADHRWVLSLSNDDAGEINGSLRNSWSNVAKCPIGSGTPRLDCTTQFTYRYTLETPCASPCQLVDDADATHDDGLTDCGASVCECP